MLRSICVFILLAVLLAGCAAPALPAPSATPAPLPTRSALSKPTATAEPTLAPLPTLAPRSTATLTLAPVDFYEPAGCLAPPTEAGEVQTVNGWQLNTRTLTMLRRAQELYGGAIQLEAAVTQGSYHDNGAASFGTHLGGGALDLSIFLPGTWTPDFANLGRLVQALRAAGFAAWVRNLDEVFPGSGYHIHAIAVGDPQLSAEAEAQLTGLAGYFRGMNGLPDARTAPDRYGGPVVCDWMRNLGYADLREPDAPVERTPAPALLQSRAEVLADTDRETLIRQLNAPVAGLDRALALELWRAARLLPVEAPPAATLRAWLNAGREDPAFWALFSREAYKQMQVAPGGDYSPRSGDLLLLPGAPEQMRVVLEVTPRDITALVDDAGDVAVRRLPLPDLRAAGLVALRPLYADAPGETIGYTVQPGDTLPSLAARFGSTVEAIARRNGLVELGVLEIGQELRIGE